MSPDSDREMFDVVSPIMPAPYTLPSAFDDTSTEMLPDWTDA